MSECVFISKSNLEKVRVKSVIVNEWNIGDDNLKNAKKILLSVCLPISLSI